MSITSFMNMGGILHPFGSLINDFLFHCSIPAAAAGGGGGWPTSFDIVFFKFALALEDLFPSHPHKISAPFSFGDSKFRLQLTINFLFCGKFYFIVFLSESLNQHPYS